MATARLTTGRGSPWISALRLPARRPRARRSYSRTSPTWRKKRINLAGIVITHAHEDHYGALIELWPRLGVPVFATAFTAGMLSAKLGAEPDADLIPVTVVAAGDRFKVGPFEIEYINVTHSIPEANALAIRTPLGLALHSGDWKLDDSPVIGSPTDVHAAEGDRRGRCPPPW